MAYIFLFQKEWGTVTRLANKYNTSLTFIYDNAKIFKNLLERDNSNQLETKDKEYLRYILSFRLEGKSSIPSISKMMKRIGISNSSVGFISQTLTKIGAELGNDLNIKHVNGFTFSSASDEIFAKKQPILITIDPVSALMLKIKLSGNRSKEAWIAHFQEIKEQNISISQITNDEGTGMKAAVNSELSDVDRQSDTFHAVAHRLGLYVERFFKNAYKLLELEAKFINKLNKAKTDEEKRIYIEEAVELSKKIDNAIELYEHFEIIYHWLLESFQCFDKNGVLKNVETVKSDFDVAIQYLKDLNNKDINKEVKSIENCKSDLFTFYKTAKEKINFLSQTIDNKTLNLLSLAWQVNKSQIKSKNKFRRNKLKRREEYILNEVKELIDNQKYEKIKETVYHTLDHIIQSSAIVECINSILRYYLNSSNNKITQESLNLFMFYHNHRRFENGKRKGKTPMEIATNSVQKEDWLELMLQKVNLN